eukprot:gnl/MRDRNA2_/MRDRNA2_110920_c0_seq1.p1 gnl/MRDRNA2_/MRDRNA2_110920_c0~~gnl/MRDRNA2_/MRDRNA2_110920_c0_seq1.p1  ORF type:complete len:390 (-),score=54.68 gnl/MRDRNA2_/MRDRNA2_110920_c0_seq1:97-1266(-)
MGVVSKLSSSDSSAEQSWKHAFWQQDFDGSNFPKWFYSHTCQIWCNLVLGSALLAIGVAYLAIQNSILELAVPYDHSTQRHTFTLDADWPGPVFVYYEIENFHVNYKSFVESKDHFVVGSSFSKYNCKGAETYEEALRIRPGDQVFAKTIENLAEVRPCGVASFSFPLDRFELYRSVNASENGRKEQRLVLDESDLALDADREHFRRKLIPGDDGQPTIDNQPSFLWAETEKERAALLEHFMVWYRGASSSRFRNLWARIDESLPAGTYSWVFQNQSEVWSRWRVKKKVVLSTMSTFGSNNQFLGAAFIFAGVALLGVSLAFRSPPGGGLPASGENLRPDLKEALQQIVRKRHGARVGQGKSERLTVTSVVPHDGDVDSPSIGSPGAAW